MSGVKDGEIAGGNRTRSLLVMSEIAMAMILLAAAGVLAKGFLKLSQVDTGIDVDRVLIFEMSLPEARYRKGQRNRLAEEFLTELQAQPGVTAAALSNALPSQRSRIWVGTMDSTGRPLKSHEIRVISSGYVKAAGMTLIAGRNLNEGDRAGQPLVVLVNHTYAKRFGSAASAVGRFIRGVDDAYAVPRPRAAQIVGVVEDVQPVGLDRVIKPEVFTDYRQDAAGYWLEHATFFTVRTAGDPAAVTANARAVLRRLDPELMIESAGMLTERLADTVAQPRFYAVLVGIFATVAVTLAAVGIYGVMMFAVSQRTREIGIRIALGAGRRDVLGLVLRQGALLAVVGIALGLAGAFVLTRYLQSVIFGTSTFDPQVFAILSSVLGAITVLACYVPARRATRVDPIVALRNE
jgi:predicted permease